MSIREPKIPNKLARLLFSVLGAIRGLFRAYGPNVGPILVFGGAVTVPAGQTVPLNVEVLADGSINGWKFNTLRQGPGLAALQVRSIAIGDMTYYRQAGAFVPDTPEQNTVDLILPTTAMGTALRDNPLPFQNFGALRRIPIRQGDTIKMSVTSTDTVDGTMQVTFEGYRLHESE